MSEESNDNINDQIKNFMFWSFLKHPYNEIENLNENLAHHILNEISVTGRYIIDFDKIFDFFK